MKRLNWRRPRRQTLPTGTVRRQWRSRCGKYIVEEHRNPKLPAQFLAMVRRGGAWLILSRRRTRRAAEKHCQRSASRRSAACWVNPALGLRPGDAVREGWVLFLRPFATRELAARVAFRERGQVASSGPQHDQQAQWAVIVPAPKKARKASPVTPKRQRAKKINPPTPATIDPAPSFMLDREPLHFCPTPRTQLQLF